MTRGTLVVLRAEFKLWRDAENDTNRKAERGDNTPAYASSKFSFIQKLKNFLHKNLWPEHFVASLK